jgi:thiol:disulfide interchange protein DsbD
LQPAVRARRGAFRVAAALLLACLAVVAGGSAAAQDLLDPEKAFRFSARAEPGRIEVRFDIANGYYLYRERFRFAVEPEAAKLGTPDFPAGAVKDDDFFGRVETYRKQLVFRLPVEGSGRVTLKVTSQGCADAGVCYTPMDSVAKLTLVAAGAPMDAATAAAMPLREDAGAIARMLGGSAFWAVVATFFGFGVLLAFTPCVLPMIPILSGMIAGDGAKSSRARGLAFSTAYVLGMALTYTAAGVAAGLSGTLLAASLQSPWVLGAFALVFVVLALSMFDLYEIRLPHAAQTVLAHGMRRIPGGRIAGVFLLGALSALIVSPCVAAPLAGALLYIGQRGDVWLGGTALFALALGMGAPLIAVGVSTASLLPKAGRWMDRVKHFFGVMLLCVAIWIVAPVVAVAVQMALWGSLLLVSAMFLRAIDPLPANAAGIERFGKGVGVVGLIAGSALWIGALSGATDPLQPLAGLRGAGLAADAGKPAAAPDAAKPAFRKARTADELDAAIRESGGKPVLLDFYADWCVSCKEMERFTLSVPDIRRRLDRMHLVQIDVTGNSADDRALLKRFNLFGPPGILFFGRDGQEIRGLRVIGFQPADRFGKVLDLVLDEAGVGS